MDFLKYIPDYKKTHPEIASMDDWQLLEAWRHGRFNFR